MDTEEGDLSELLLEKRDEPAKSSAELYCKPFCRQAGKEEL